MQMSPYLFTQIQSRTTLIDTATKGNIDIMKLVLNEKKIFEYTFDWDKDSQGYSAYLRCVENGFIDCIKYLFSIEYTNTFDKKIDKYIKNKSNMNALLVACNNNQSKMIDYLLSDIYRYNVENDKFNINDCDNSGNTAVMYCAINGNLDEVKNICNLYKDTIDINKLNNSKHFGKVSCTFPYVLLRKK